MLLSMGKTQRRCFCLQVLCALSLPCVLLVMEREDKAKRGQLCIEQTFEERSCNTETRPGKVVPTTLGRAGEEVDCGVAQLQDLRSCQEDRFRCIHEVVLPAIDLQVRRNDLSICYKLTRRLPSVVLLPLQTLVGDKIIKSNDAVGNLVAFEGLQRDYVKMIEEYKGRLELYHEYHICLPRAPQDDAKQFCFNPEGFSHYLSLMAAIPLDNQTTQSPNWDMATSNDSASLFLYSVIHKRYVLTRNVGRGGFGDVWLGSTQKCSLEDEGSEETEEQLPSSIGFIDLHNFEASYEGNSNLRASNSGYGDPLGVHNKEKEIYVLKRILVEKGIAVFSSGMREKYFGELFLNALISSMKGLAGRQSGKQHTEEEPGDSEVNLLNHIARYVECIEVYNQEEFWLVFRNEGRSLSTLLYTIQETTTMNDDSKAGHVHALQPSLWWKWLKTTEAGQTEMRSLLYQLLLALKACHDRNITHRDIKPENMVVRAATRCTHTGDDGQMQTDWPCNLTMRIIDFGSAVDPYTLQHLYGRGGPSRAEQTAEYTPPEAFLQGHWLRNHGSHGTMYDMWSVGVVMLELILGTPHVFQISDRTRALLDQWLVGWDKTPLETAYILRALWEMCILLPGHTAHHYYQKTSRRLDNIEMLSWMCTEEALMQQIRQHDPLGLGVTDIWALRLIRRLLQWYPEDRISAADALQHPYFHPTLQE